MQQATTTSFAGRVLVVEDDRATRYAMRMLLQHHGYAVEVAGTVAEAMSLVGAGHDFVLLDLMLPDGHGGEVLEWLRDNAPMARVAVVTGCNDPRVLKAVEALEPEVLLQKPVDFLQILARFRSPRPATRASQSQ